MSRELLTCGSRRSSGFGTAGRRTAAQGRSPWPRYRSRHQPLVDPPDTGKISSFVDLYNHCRYHESIGNLTPADDYTGRSQTILERGEAIKRKTIEHRRLLHRQATASTDNPDAPKPPLATASNVRIVLTTDSQDVSGTDTPAHETRTGGQSMHGIEHEATIYWTTANFLADAKRLGIYLTREDIDQIKINALHLHASRWTSVRRCAHNLPTFEPIAIEEPQIDKSAKNEISRSQRQRHTTSPEACELPNGVVRFTPRVKGNPVDNKDETA